MRKLILVAFVVLGCLGGAPVAAAPGFIGRLGAIGVDVSLPPAPPEAALDPVAIEQVAVAAVVEVVPPPVVESPVRRFLGPPVRMP